KVDIARGGDRGRRGTGRGFDGADVIVDLAGRTGDSDQGNGRAGDAVPQVVALILSAPSPDLDVGRSRGERDQRATRSRHADVDEVPEELRVVDGVGQFEQRRNSRICRRVNL